jgi:ferredoxin
MTIGRDKREFIELNKEDILVEGYDNTPRQIPGKKTAAEAGGNFKETKLCFTEEQIKKETARCLSCGQSIVDENKCIGCGVCTTKCAFDAIKLHREHPKASRMTKSEDKLKAILPNILKREVKILLNPNRNSMEK